MGPSDLLLQVWHRGLQGWGEIRLRERRLPSTETTNQVPGDLVARCDCASIIMAADKLKAEKEVRAQEEVCQVSKKIRNTAIFKSVHEASICLCFSLP